VFDSGVGGLTVLRALLAAMPSEHFVYLGDTARLPYGTKSPATVERYALQAANALIDRRVKALIIACNTASAVALPALRARHPALPVIGVVEPGAAAAVAASSSGRIAVIGTQATVQGGAYTRAITALRPPAQVHALACQLFVSLAEEGWTHGEVAHAVAQRLSHLPRCTERHRARVLQQLHAEGCAAVPGAHPDQHDPVRGLPHRDGVHCLQRHHDDLRQAHLDVHGDRQELRSLP